MHVVIMGCGRVGSSLAKALERRDHSVAMIDVDANAFRRLGSEFRGITIKGVGFDRETLTAAGIHRAEAFAAVPVQSARTWVGVAGTMTTLAALGAGLPEYDSDAIHLSTISLPELDRVCRNLIGMTRADRAALGPMHPGRVDVIGGGSLITLELARVLSESAGIDELVVSEHDILDGIALGILD